MILILDRIALYLLGVCLLLQQDLENRLIYLLIGLIFVGVTFYMSERRKYIVEKLLYLFLLPLTILFPETAFFSTLLVYSGIYKYFEQKLYSIVLSLTGLGTIFLAAKRLSVDNLLPIIVFLLLAIFMGIKSTLLTKAVQRIIHIRDAAAEDHSILYEKNKYLADNMEKEIHIATLSERNRIAREIHDNVGHLLSRSILQLGAIMAIHKTEPVAHQLSPLKDTLDQAMNNIRDSVHDLHKESFDIKDAAQNILGDLTCKVKLECDFSLDADKEVKYAFLTILKEAVTNIRKHSNASIVTVIITELEEYYQLLIEDNGTAKKAIHNPQAGIGLQNMEDRIQALNGFITFSTTKGFRIFVSVPKHKS